MAVNIASAAAWNARAGRVVNVRDLRRYPGRLGDLQLARDLVTFQTTMGLAVDGHLNPATVRMLRDHIASCDGPGSLWDKRIWIGIDTPRQAAPPRVCPDILVQRQAAPKLVAWVAQGPSRGAALDVGAAGQPFSGRPAGGAASAPPPPSPAQKYRPGGALVFDKPGPFDFSGGVGPRHGEASQADPLPPGVDELGLEDPPLVPEEKNTSWWWLLLLAAAAGGWWYYDQNKKKKKKKG